jgi:hypothetical protein
MAEEINKPENRGYMDNGNARFKRRPPRSCSGTLASSSTRSRK